MKNLMPKLDKASNNKNANPTLQLVAGTALALAIIASMTLVLAIMQSNMQAVMH